MRTSDSANRFSVPHIPAGVLTGCSSAPPFGRNSAPGTLDLPAAGGSSHAAVGFGQSQAADGSRLGSGPRYFSCGEAGHRQSTCPRRGGSLALVTDFDFEGTVYLFKCYFFVQRD
ncbi:peptide chain release factor 1 [Striga asiatica]|uniref:Peptide chain release factor 1 n=1 Tax=Striga asiatica TaxID=4170 RepID=A0A5A7P542_STRAF|nr:peptide chain release factor 1 [Striga asiatica]